MAGDRDTTAAEGAAIAAAEAARAAREAAREASVTLGNLQLQAGARLDVMDELAEALREGRATMLEALELIDGLATVEDVQQSAAATREEQAGRRRLTVVRTSAALLWVIIGVAWGVNQQVEHCSPGSKAYRVTRLLTNPREQLTVDRLQEAARRPAPVWCDVTLPTTAHSPLDDWPTTANLEGFAGYLIAAAGTVWVVRRRSWEGDAPPVVGDVPSSP